MTVGEIAGLIAAVAFVLLVGMCAIPLFKLGRLLDELTGAVKDVNASTAPILAELQDTVEAANTELTRLGGVTTEVEKVTADVARVSGHASTVVENTATLSQIWLAAFGRPLIALASSFHGFRAALSAKVSGGQR
ncbi:DUF948 domain-containing protein [Propioniciclava coleopterorum]|uniref:DUF948 domain-containing protein n=1 Tax=Propioniciclava coleopterorum TaxID=2714937 RepID=A0A6G7YA57_9ACTN|nr:DUF948 domain-containing protein [Propioniciclava coleopterorum]QIK73566.1 DUF948 domain-containing protein [Propioniciclava coleopterorum]